MDLLQAIFLTVMQGVTEFLPISDSGHLAVCLYFRRDRLNMGRAAITAPQHRKTEDPDNRLLFWAITLLAALAGLLFEGIFRTARNEPPLMTALVLGFSGSYYAGQRSVEASWGTPRFDAARYRFVLAPSVISSAGTKDVLSGSRTTEQHNRNLPNNHGFSTSKFAGCRRCIRRSSHLPIQQGLIGFVIVGAQFGILRRLAALFS